ncbi:YicC/YloC family endoribonuclease [Simiduia curdlanivorans]|uniref:YicC/YloC family endoribonuclease n=1 Tax=Simiduia curdlanivorans TaxID=1492769 RepID=A0ABV8V026_9GAMM|nr:YicC/YloC family endoribonuclease [Simiduia curdlanivorans]MDN3637935.1 YicC/YloC family endoribonuclease [Simiduia curdlanivorans]
MPRSMTGFGRIEASFDWGNLSWEVRSVNHRYLEPHFRLPETQRQCEPALRDVLRKVLNRGKVEATLQLQVGKGDNSELCLDSQRIDQIINAVEQLGRSNANLAPINPLELLRWPGVVVEDSLDHEALNAAVVQGFADALTQLSANREREGAELGQFIEQRLAAIAEQVAEVRKLMPSILQAQKEKLVARVAELNVQLEPERIEQEIALLAQKADVDEELDRLSAHITEVRLTLKKSEPIGRRLDFLMQELNREANTLSSKSVVSETTQAAVELKVLIEQMREQVQNIE